MKILYLDCFSGISGDMTLASLVDLGADKNYIEEELKKLSLNSFELQWNRVLKCGLSALKLDIQGEKDSPHRHYRTIIEMIDSSGIHPEVIQTAKKIFTLIGEAEAKIHGLPLEKIHFHEVGGFDSILDIVGASLALHSLGADKIHSSPIPLGSGFVECRHGHYPIPALATLEILKGIPLQESSLEFELTTPTGAGIVAAVVEKFQNGLPALQVEKIGYGAGTRDLPNQPNVLRSVLGELVLS